MTAIGFVGLGAMGSRIAARLLASATSCTAPTEAGARQTRCCRAGQDMVSVFDVLFQLAGSDRVPT